MSFSIVTESIKVLMFTVKHLINPLMVIWTVILRLNVYIFDPYGMKVIVKCFMFSYHSKWQLHPTLKCP